MSAPIQSVKIRNFTGIESKVSETDTPPGTLTRADGVNTVPQGALSFGPSWKAAWGESALAADIATALAGAPANQVDFVTLTRNGYTFLIAWEITAARPRGIWHVAGISDPSFSATSGATVAAPNTTVYRQKTNSLPWYGSWVQNELWLGNGTDTNLVWAAGALAVLGPATTPTNPQDPSQIAFPACTCWLPGGEGQVYGAGNAAFPLRIWCSEIPNKNFPLNRGLKTAAYSYLDLQVNATAITGLSSFGRNLIVHLNIGPPYIIEGFHGSAGGWKLSQQPTSANASAINPNCTRDTKLASYYFGSDLEFYLLPTFRGSIVNRGYDKSDWRDNDLVTKKSSGAWNVAATKPISGTDYFLIDDEKNGRTWVWLQMSAGTRNGVYCYDQRTSAMTGPWRYPDFLFACQLRDENLNGCVVCGITRDGVFLWSDLANLGNYVLPNYLVPLPSACAELTSAPTPTVGLSYVGVSADGQSFKTVLNGQTLSMATPWSDWAVGDVACTRFYANARVAVIEFSDGDMKQPALQKELLTARTIWNRNSAIYIGIYVQCNGYSYGAWRGLTYPATDWIAGIGGEGSTYRMRIIAVTFNDVPQAVLSGVNVDWMASVLN